MVKRRLGTVVAVIGLILILGAAGLTLRNIRTDNKAAAATSDLLARVRAEEVEQTGTGTEEDPAETEAPVSQYPLPGQRRLRNLVPEPEMKTVLVDGREYIGVLTIPRTGSELPVMATCTDRTINISPGRYHGTPTSGGFVIGGHNYISHLGRIDWLREGDEVLFTDVEGQSYLYKVVGSEVINANAGRDLISDEWDLSLFTCTFSGSQRLTVRCLRAEPEDDTP
ncbi:MAG: sortase [Ruminococcaceae bacterium]|jgi:sortase A|nr:sortase [Oscillospiraceae bacterium]